ncbi:PhzF family phenazine biosynthesis isomerase [Streptomyces malaysiensis subsp. malaysiensis]|uniref:PhzF family phenazine biosynthesis isomerase n=1 Tax=Streptomyces TaxID=1883 RepID=UPI001E5BD906|nr:MULTISPECIES: PhzF family phenazine biosynthesis isomerase [unclassified Streptomyces]MCD9591645.1 PhzF family phenazine biosynthesis protein [Streptomyces sp. 8ZJF_21]WHX19682.1 PhzF family phenazine biosynthesis isomerase [Streptomyces sp. NA07423]
MTTPTAATTDAAATAPTTDTIGTTSTTGTTGIEVLHYSAFTSHPDGGNPAGVVLDAAALVDGNGTDAADAAMTAVAARVGYSETAFITERDEAARRYRLRYFSPLAEVAFCGHATIATAVALAERDGPGELVFDTASGEIRVETTADGDGPPRATLTSVPTRSRPADPGTEIEPTLAALRWSVDDLDPALPPHVAYAGNDHLVLAAATRERLTDLDYDYDALEAVMRRHGWTTVHLVWRETPESSAGGPAKDSGDGLADGPAQGFVFHARDPFPVGGVVEDPATGAAAAAFGGYLRVLGLVDGPTRVRIRQGEDMGRPSDLLLDVTPGDPRVRVSGQAVPIPSTV